MATGRTNRQVADELLLSTKTVEVHLTRIYAKLGISSRSQLAAAHPPGTAAGGRPAASPAASAGRCRPTRNHAR